MIYVIAYILLGILVTLGARVFEYQAGLATKGKMSPGYLIVLVTWPLALIAGTAVFSVDMLDNLAEKIAKWK